MRLLDLFAGIGGFSLAAHWMGWETVAFVEKEAFCQKVLRKNFGQDIEIHDDIFEFSGKPFRGRVDIVTGGFPCQPFSAAGKRKGRADERHLFPEMLRVIQEVKPRWVVAENVRGLLSIESGSVFAEVVTSLEGEGYEVITFCVPASAVEAPHRRDRLWILAHSDTNAAGQDGTRQHRSQRSRSKNARRQRFRTATFGRDSDINSADVRNANREDHRPDTRNSTEVDGVSAITRRMEHGAVVSGGANRDVADTDRQRRIGRSEQGGNQGRAVQKGRGNNRSLGESAVDRGLAPDASDTGLQGDKLGGAFSEGTRASRSITERFANEHWYEAATRFCRMDDAVPNRVDRLKSLGNSVDPVIPFEIFRAIEAAE